MFGVVLSVMQEDQAHGVSSSEGASVDIQVLGNDARTVEAAFAWITLQNIYQIFLTDAYRRNNEAISAITKHTNYQRWPGRPPAAS